MSVDVIKVYLSITNPISIQSNPIQVPNCNTKFKELVVSLFLSPSLTAPLSHSLCCFLSIPLSSSVYMSTLFLLLSPRFFYPSFSNVWWHRLGQWIHRRGNLYVYNIFEEFHESISFPMYALYEFCLCGASSFSFFSMLNNSISLSFLIFCTSPLFFTFRCIQWGQSRMANKTLVFITFYVEDHFNTVIVTNDIIFFLMTSCHFCQFNMCVCESVRSRQRMYLVVCHDGSCIICWILFLFLAFNVPFLRAFSKVSAVTVVFLFNHFEHIHCFFLC